MLGNPSFFMGRYLFNSKDVPLYKGPHDPPKYTPNFAVGGAGVIRILSPCE